MGAPRGIKTGVDELYAQRFREGGARHARWRRELWQVLVDGFFERWIDPQATVLDFGCGTGHFLNAVRARRRIGVDVRHSSGEHLDPGVEFAEPDGMRIPNLGDGEICSRRWPAASPWW